MLNNMSCVALNKGTSSICNNKPRFFFFLSQSRYLEVVVFAVHCSSHKVILVSQSSGQMSTIQTCAFNYQWFLFGAGRRSAARQQRPQSGALKKGGFCAPSVELCLPSVAVHGQGRVLHHVVHRKVLQPAKLWSVVPAPQLQEEEDGDDNGGDDKRRHQAGQERV